MLKAALGCAAVVAMLASPAQACWNDNQIAAAKIRDMETMLMVSALRCRLSGQDFLAQYNGFVQQSRPALTRVNDDLRGRFEDLDGYDRYVTSIANRYGGGVEGLACEDMASILSAAMAEGGSYDGLSRLAEAAQIAPVLDGGRCEVEMAAVAP